MASFFAFLTLLFSTTSLAQDGQIMTVTGPIPPEQMGLSLIHEHILVDFAGAEITGYHRWNRDEVVERVLPFLKEAKSRGVATLLECTPAYIGRDPRLLKRVSEESGVQILTNTGYYGASKDKYLPGHAFTESADSLASRWQREFEEGIEDTGIRPGFMKIGVDAATPFSGVHEKLVRAAARTHLKTGLTIASHTGPASAAFQIIAILEEEGVSPSAFVWLHAPSVEDFQHYREAGKKRTWIGLDGAGNTDDHVARLVYLKEYGLLSRVLLSHDAGWYSPGEPDGGDFSPYTALFDRLVPALKEKGFSDQDLQQILVENPREAYTIHVRALRAGKMNRE